LEPENWELIALAAFGFPANTAIPDLPTVSAEYFEMIR
jgi:hypothetical protein